MPPLAPLEIHLSASLEQGITHLCLVLHIQAHLLDHTGAHSVAEFDLLIDSPDDLSNLGSTLHRLSTALSKAQSAKSN